MCNNCGYEVVSGHAILIRAFRASNKIWQSYPIPPSNLEVAMQIQVNSLTKSVMGIISCVTNFRNLKDENKRFKAEYEDLAGEFSRAKKFDIAVLKKKRK